ncbi:hypothetical protein [Taibaiella soli]|uniref:Lipocalin-like domain-containing protein n=1 Tax=Taibaiella soli TaxID=1649169 RepID=A0A2W2B1P8_9BACT|nr:hypothetical protein [Taibaiella soli]PZF74184.1 hypothetical protein DN068_03980 [Taibaiella soli]
MKSYVLKVSALLLAGAALLTACHKDDNNNPAPSNNGNGGNTSGSCTNNGLAKFLKVGNKLVYDYSEVYTDDSVFTMEVTGTTSAGSYQFALTGGGQVFASAPARVMRECNDWVKVSASGEPTNLTYKLNRAQGDSWVVGSSTYTVVEKNVTVSTPAGNFVCDKLSYYTPGTINTDTIYYNNDIGQVKYDGLLYEYTLRSKNF